MFPLLQSCYSFSNSPWMEIGHLYIESLLPIRTWLRRNHRLCWIHSSSFSTEVGSVSLPGGNKKQCVLEKNGTARVTRWNTRQWQHYYITGGWSQVKKEDKLNPKPLHSKCLLSFRIQWEFSDLLGNLFIVARTLSSYTSYNGGELNNKKKSWRENILPNRILTYTQKRAFVTHEPWVWVYIMCNNNGNLLWPVYSYESACRHQRTRKHVFIYFLIQMNALQFFRQRIVNMKPNCSTSHVNTNNNKTRKKKIGNE